MEFDEKIKQMLINISITQNKIYPQQWLLDQQPQLEH